MTSSTLSADPVRRGGGERGSAVVAALVLLFAFTAGGVIWLSRDVNRVVANRSAAQSIAFQSARAGAQQVEVGSLREGDRSAVELNDERARQESGRIANELFEAYGVSGSSSMVISGDTVTVTVTIDDPTGDVTVSGSVQAQAGP
jgi:hypothetical protein